MNECAQEVGYGQPEPLGNPPSTPGVGHGWVTWEQDPQGEASGRCWAHISWPDGDPLVVRIHARNDDRHTPGSPEAQDIGFLRGRCLLGQPL